MSPAAPADKSLTWWPFVGALVIALIGVTVIVVVGSGGQSHAGLKTDDDGALVCVTHYDQPQLTDTRVQPAWVPVRNAGVDDSVALVPGTKPLNLTICHYTASTVTDRAVQLPLEGSKVVRTGIAGATKTLSKSKTAGPPARACTPSPQGTYLIGFVMTNGSAIWIADPDNGCQNVTNGEFQTARQIRPRIVDAYQTGVWH